jgi:DNA-binding cell septation regulator SpoVG
MNANATKTTRPSAQPAPSKPETIEISEYRPYNKNTLRAFFTATLPSGMVLHDLSLHEKGEQRWVSTPTRPWKDQENKVQYSPLITFIDGPTRDQFRDDVLKAIDQYESE